MRLNLTIQWQVAYFNIFAQQQMKDYIEGKHNCVRDATTNFLMLFY